MIWKQVMACSLAEMLSLAWLFTWNTLILMQLSLGETETWILLHDPVIQRKGARHWIISQATSLCTSYSAQWGDRLRRKSPKLIFYKCGFNKQKDWFLAFFSSSRKLICISKKKTIPSVENLALNSDSACWLSLKSE